MNTETRIRDTSVTLGGLRFHYREWGLEDAHPIVLLHGWTDNCHVWDTVAAGLSDNYRLLTLDQRGHGESEWAPSWRGYTLEDRTRDLAALIDTLALKDVIVVGHSGGGSHPAYMYASQVPGRVRALVIVDAGPGPRDGADALPSPTGADDARSIWYTAVEIADIEAAYAEVRSLWTLRHLSDDELRRRFDSNLTRLENGSWTWSYDKALRSPIGLTLPPEDEAAQWDALTRIACPTLLIRGDESHSVSRAKAERIARAIPNCRWVEVSRSTHYPHMDNPAGFLAEIRPFLDSLNSL